MHQLAPGVVYSLPYLVQLVFWQLLCLFRWIHRESSILHTPQLRMLLQRHPRMYARSGYLLVCLFQADILECVPSSLSVHQTMSVLSWLVARSILDPSLCTSAQFDNHFRACIPAFDRRRESCLCSSSPASSSNTESMESSMYVDFRIVSSANGNSSMNFFAWCCNTNWTWKGDEFVPNTTQSNSYTSG